MTDKKLCAMVYAKSMINGKNNCEYKNMVEIIYLNKYLKEKINL